MVRLHAALRGLHCDACLSRWVTTPRNGYRMHYRAAMESALYGRPPVVLVHGLIVASTYMEPLAEALLPWFPVFVPDLPGFGRSGKAAPSALTLPQLTDALVDWLDACHIPRAHFVGNSMGCQLIVDLASRYPAYVERCVLQGPTMDSSRRSMPEQMFWLAVNGLQEPPSMGCVMLKDYWRAGVARSLSTMHGALHDRMDRKLSHVRAPTLVVFSEYDTVAPLHWCSFVTSQLEHGSLVALQNAAHTANYSSTPQLARAVRRFLLGNLDAYPVPPGVLPVYPSKVYRPLPVADFDSATAMLRATAATLRGEDLPQLGVMKNPLVARFVVALNALPAKLRTPVYAWTGALEATSAEEFNKLNVEDIYDPMLEPYPGDTTYPVIAIGSSNGALTHLYAALGIPWLPQTLLVPVKRSSDEATQADGNTIDMTAEMHWGQSVTREFLERNPTLQVHHMADPNQDLLMVKYMAYFRLKMRRLTESYAKFITRRLQKNGTLLVVNCKQSWPVVRCSDQHFFQPGAIGGLQPEEYLNTNKDVANFIAEHHSGRKEPAKNWNPPVPNDRAPEAEWGFEEMLLEDLANLARQNGYHIKVIEFAREEVPSPMVADLYRDWYIKERKIHPQGLLVSSFILMDPWLTIRLGLIPYWSVFSIQPSLQSLSRYLRACAGKDERYARVLLAQFNHGIKSVGVADASEWISTVREHMAVEPLFIGSTAERFPLDFASIVQFNTDLREVAKSLQHSCVPDPMSFEYFERFLGTSKEDYGVRMYSFV